MAIITYDTMIIELVRQMDTIMGTFLRDGYNSLASALKAPFISLCALFIVLTGYGITKGFIKAPLQELYKFIFRLGFIYFFAMNWGNFSFYIVGLFDEGASLLGATVMKSTHTPAIMIGKSLEQGLQSVLTEVFDVGCWTMKKMSIKNWWPYYTALFIWISGMAVVGVALFEIVLAKLMLSICLSTAPLFIIFTLFDKTRSFFDSWLGTVVGFSFVLMFVSTVVGLSMGLIHWSIAGYLPNEAKHITSVGWAPIFFVASLSIAALLQAASIAKHIGGACHTAGGSSVVGGLVGGTMGGAMMAMKTGKALRDFSRGRRGAGENPGVAEQAYKFGMRGEI